VYRHDTRVRPEVHSGQSGTATVCVASRKPVFLDEEVSACAEVPGLMPMRSRPSTKRCLELLQTATVGGTQKPCHHGGSGGSSTDP
jgi:hypothetical protein